MNDLAKSVIALCLSTCESERAVGNFLFTLLTA